MNKELIEANLAHEVTKMNLFHTQRIVLEYQAKETEAKIKMLQESLKDTPEDNANSSIGEHMYGAA